MAAEIVKAGKDWGLEISDRKVVPGLLEGGIFRTFSFYETRNGLFESFTCHMLTEDAIRILNMAEFRTQAVAEMIQAFIKFQALWVRSFGVRCDDCFTGFWRGHEMSLNLRWIEDTSLHMYYRLMGERYYPPFDYQKPGISNCVWVSGSKPDGAYVAALVPLQCLLQDTRIPLFHSFATPQVTGALAWTGPTQRWECGGSCTSEMQRAIELTQWDLAQMPTV
jgi:hypothetical protein